MTKDDVVCGTHSNIPLCCIAFYDSGAWEKIRDDILPQMEYCEWSKKAKSLIPTIWLNNEGQYIMCPDCMVRYLLGRFKPHIVKDCNCRKIR